MDPFSSCPTCGVISRGEHVCAASTPARYTSATFRADPTSALRRASGEGAITITDDTGGPRAVIAFPGAPPCDGCDEVLDMLEALMRWCVTMRETGRVESLLARHTRCLRLLADRGRFAIEIDDGDRVVGRWRS